MDACCWAIIPVEILTTAQDSDIKVDDLSAKHEYLGMDSRLQSHT